MKMTAIYHVTAIRLTSKYSKAFVEMTESFRLQKKTPCPTTEVAGTDRHFGDESQGAATLAVWSQDHIHSWKNGGTQRAFLCGLYLLIVIMILKYLFTHF